MNGTDEKSSMCDFKEFDLLRGRHVEKLGCETVLKLGWEPRLRRGEEEGEDRREEGEGGAGIAASKAQHRKSEASVWVLLTGGTHLYPISYQSAFFFLFVALASIFLTLLLPRLNILQELPGMAKM